mmetsp:Transcript_5669/g.8794  ORF Transcript_5669/g.8794 Transcript_5669/m.8794 type:complete len:81 (-) Transcript_5669:142-384(-)
MHHSSCSHHELASTPPRLVLPFHSSNNHKHHGNNTAGDGLGVEPQVGGGRPKIFEFQTYYIPSNIDKISSYIPPIEIPKV